MTQSELSSRSVRPLRREELLSAITREEARLDRLEAEQTEARTRVAALRSELASLGSVPESSADLSSHTSSRVPRTPSEKIRLFRSLFRGRTDVFPTRFTSRRTGKSGYAPACRNKFVQGTCELPKIKCAECANQAFFEFDDAAVLGHLTGRHVMGVYPLLEDETCWFLAVDFDKSTWEEDVSAFVETCRSADLPAAIERSRSGNGAHVWFFFAAPVPASDARKMGCHLITETMSRRHQLEMESYDRLFPSQDTLPRGGFGNLIALPLQHEARREGNTVFLDAQLRPYADDQQWAYLASVPRIDPRVIARIADEATRAGSVLGLRPAEGTDEERATPWNRRPSGHPHRIRVTEALPRQVRAVLAQKLFVEKVGLPSLLLDQIKRLAAFQNPEFYKRQSMRLSTAVTPRVIACAEDLPQHVGLPRGCRNELESFLHQYRVALDVVDQRAVGEAIQLEFQGALTPVQEAAAKALLAHDTGVLVAPPGAGKTVVGSWLVAERGCSTLVLVHRRPLLEQWVAQLSVFLGIDPKEIGQIGASKRTRNGRLDVAMIQSLVRKGQVDDVVAGYGHVVVDECHHLPAVSFERVLAEAKARYVVGLTATPQRRDGHHPITEMQLGPVRFEIGSRNGASARPFEQRLYVRNTAFRMTSDGGAPTIQQLYAALAEDERRNALILDDVIRALEEGHSPILLTERKDHLNYLASRLESFTRHLVVLRGGMSARERRSVKERLAAIPENEERLLLATGRYAGEGFDDARLDTLFLALPVSWRGTLIQYAGRLHRLHPGKKEVRIFDYVDRDVPMLLRMFDRRLRGYRAIGYVGSEAPIGFDQTADQRVVEHAEERFHALDAGDDFP